MKTKSVFYLQIKIFRGPQAIQKYSDTHPLKPVLVRIQWILI